MPRAGLSLRRVDPYDNGPEPDLAYQQPEPPAPVRAVPAAPTQPRPVRSVPAAPTQPRPVRAVPPITEDRAVREDRVSRERPASRERPSTREGPSTRGRASTRPRRPIPPQRPPRVQGAPLAEPRRAQRPPEQRPSARSASVPAGAAAATNAIPERRTIVIQGRGAERYRGMPQRKRPAPRRHERAGFRPDRAAMWAVVLCVLMILVAATSSHAATLHHARLSSHAAPLRALHAARHRR